ncbi:hypothetical protein K491DRAFT_214672 [Lophiostoma macrostomum CBS 122681]|uniref:F-box domain-containing protein n=1 Tax=Lophiostoma macrostomum CBS 122681 TaxID=1314788 RepID=A0A6A6SRB9_9PLEO|nr:hypothetical protein K491DRAFT_214672 [Lophiostoma macrostomum CBS 122681]
MADKGLFYLPLELRRQVYSYLCPIWTKPFEYGGLRLACRQIQNEYDTESVTRAGLYYRFLENHFDCQMPSVQSFCSLKDLTMVARIPSDLRDDKYKALPLELHSISSRKIKITMQISTPVNRDAWAPLIWSWMGLLITLVEYTNLQSFQLVTGPKFNSCNLKFVATDWLSQRGRFWIVGSNRVLTWTRRPLKLGPIRSSQERKLPDRALYME